MQSARFMHNVSRLGLAILCLGSLLLAFSSNAAPIASEEPAAKISRTLSSADTSAAATPQKPRFIALILPQTSRALGPAAEAVRTGFLAGAMADGRRAVPFRLYPIDDEGATLTAAYRKAIAEGALAVVGGVTRDGASVIAREGAPVPTLALNAPPEGAVPENFYFVSLSLEHEARFLARETITDNKKRAVILAGTSALAKRLADSFEKEWLAKRGEIVGRLTVGSEVADGLKIKASFEKWRDVSLVFIALDAKAARLLRPYLPNAIPIYATSHSLNPYAGVIENRDLDGVRYLEMPWFVERDHLAVMSYARPSADLPLDYERLYALGIDAWRLTQLVMTDERARNLPSLDGVTGKLTLDSGNQFVRSLTQLEMRDGQPRALSSAP